MKTGYGECGKCGEGLTPFSGTCTNPQCTTRVEGTGEGAGEPDFFAQRMERAHARQRRNAREIEASASREPEPSTDLQKIRDAVENFCGHDWPDGKPLPDFCPECDKIAQAVMGTLVSIHLARPAVPVGETEHEND